LLLVVPTTAQASADVAKGILLGHQWKQQFQPLIRPPQGRITRGLVTRARQKPPTDEIR
jgi:hypothetical protein